MAVSRDGTAVYIASRDPVGTDGGTGLKIFGVAKLDASGDIVSGAVAPLAAGPQDPGDGTTVAPTQIGAATIAVAAASNVPERTVNSADPSSADRFAPVTSFVYAALDPASCGKGKPIDCGVVTIDPLSTISPDAGNLAADPVDPAVVGSALTPDSGPAATLASAQKYRAPMPIPGVPLHIAIGFPPASGSQRILTDSVNPGLPLLNIAPASGTRVTGAVAMVSSSDGHVYWLDLSRWGPPSDVPVTRGGVSVTSASSSTVAAGQNQLGLWLDVAPFGATAFTPAVKADAAGLAAAFDVWPGFTDVDTWTLAYQGALPSLGSRPGLLVTNPSGTTYAAAQTAGGVLSAEIADPSLGVRAGDILELPGVCEATVASVLGQGDPNLPAGIGFPGGAVQIAPTASGTPVLPVCTAAQLPAAGAASETTITVRASGLVLSNLKLGYLGRPEIARTADASENAFSVAWSSAADGATSPAGEARSVARKARRLFYPPDGPCPIPNATAGTEEALATGCYGTGRKRITDPLAPGPIIRFRVGLVGNPSAPALPPRGTSIGFTTLAGFAQTFRKPIVGGAGAGAAISFDRTARDPAGNVKPQFAGNQNDPIFFFAPYQDDQVAVFSPSQSAAQVTSVR
jgi:hypothetical protein